MIQHLNIRYHIYILKNFNIRKIEKKDVIATRELIIQKTTYTYPCILNCPMPEGVVTFIINFVL